MWDIFQKTLPFFGLIGLGYVAGLTRFFSAQATEYLTRFVFYFALSAMIFRFAANISLAQVFNRDIVFAYLSAGIAVYLLATFVAMRRKIGLAETAVEAQCAVIGNVGFLGLPMLVLLLGERSVGPVMVVLIIDLVVFSNLMVILITVAREKKLRLGIFTSIGGGLIRNPMIVSIFLGIMWSGFSLPIPTPADEFLRLLGGAATPGALFAIGASLATKSAERLSVAAWLTFCKLALHPLAVAICALYIFDVEPYSAAVMIAAASLPVAGNVYILAQHYGVAPQRVSAAILVSTALSVITVSIVISWVQSAANL